MKRQKTTRIEIEGHTYHKGQHFDADGVQGIVTRVKGSSVWVGPEPAPEPIPVPAPAPAPQSPLTAFVAAFNAVIAKLRKLLVIYV